ncbi:hypothetical protein ACSFA0_22465 [Variovorax sp. LT1P1]|uniref:hypothetical protein n=1 Tax=Variovorax sp. LT1P1 TaxID=3443730 RepID=UPI003F473928
MSFIEDLIESDDTLTHADPAVDSTLRDLLRQAAAEGSVRLLRRAIQRGQINRSTDSSIVTAAVGVLGSDRQVNRLLPKERELRAAFVGEWVDAVAGPKPTDQRMFGAWQARVGPLLDACFTSYLNGHDHVAGVLLQLGVAVDGHFQVEPVGSDGWSELAGARLATQEKASTVTTFGRAIAVRSRWLTDIAARTPGQVPVVATVRVGIKEAEVSALTYALVLGDVKALRALIAGLDVTAPSVRAQMGEAIEQAGVLGLLDFGPDEVLHGVATLLAAGAVLADPDAFMTRAVTMIDVPCLANDPLATREQAVEVQEAVRTATIHWPAALLHSPYAKDLLPAFKSLHQAGWNPNVPVRVLAQGATAEGERDCRTVAHLAAFRGDTSIVAALRFLGCDFSKDDGRGQAPISYAVAGAAFRREAVGAELGRMLDPAFVPRQPEIMVAPSDMPEHESAPQVEIDGPDMPHLSPTVDAVGFDDFEDANALALVASNEQRSEDNHTIGFDFGDPEPKAVARGIAAPPTAADAAGARSIPGAHVLPADASARPLSAFERLRLGQTQRGSGLRR